MTLKPLTLLIDTNLLFEGKRLEDLPWAELNADPITVLVTRPVLNEIDKHKKGSGRTKKRALEVFGRIRDMIKSGQQITVIQEAGPRVIFERASGLAFDEDHAGVLNRSKTDDHLIGLLSSAIKENPERDICFFTHDTGPADMASELNLPFRLMEENWLRPARQTDEAKTINTLQADLAKFQDQEPRIAISLEGCDAPGGPIILARHTACPLSDAEIEGLMLDLQSRCPMQTDFKTVRTIDIADLGPALAGQGVSYEKVSEEKIAVYQNQTYPAWLAKCREVFGMLHESLSVETSPQSLRYSMTNTGSRPAEQVRVSFRADGDIYLLRRDQDDVDCEENDDIKDQEDCTELSLPNMPRPPVPKRIVKSNPDLSIGAARGLPGTGVGRFSSMSSILGEGTAFSRITALQSEIDRIVNPLNDFDRLGVHGVVQRPDFNLSPIMPYRPPPHKPESFYYDKWPEGSAVDTGSLTCDLWRHQSDAEYFSFEIHADQDTFSGGSLLVEVHAQNLTQPKILRTKIKVDETMIDVLAAAEQLIRKLL